MRPDRLITLNLIQPLRRALARMRLGNPGSSAFSLQSLALAPALPVLMYHSISDDREPGVRPYYRVGTSPQRFREQMQWLKDNGFQGVTLSAGLKSKSEIKKVVLTFDDGFRDFHTAAWPILREFGFTATMYLPTAFIGDAKSEIENRKSEKPIASTPPPTAYRPQPTANAPPPKSPSSPPALGRLSFHGKACLTWDEVRELHRAGIEFGSHTVTHPKLVELASAEIESEIRNSKLAIENHLGAPCTAFAYPYAFPSSDRAFVQLFVESLQAAGYHSNVTTRIGLAAKNDDPFTLRRLPVNSDDDEALFLAKLAGAYDWLAWPQESLKTMKRVVSRRRRCGRPAPGSRPLTADR